LVFDFETVIPPRTILEADRKSKPCRIVEAAGNISWSSAIASVVTVKRDSLHVGENQDPI
jgi:hypothetical protein